MGVSLTRVPRGREAFYSGAVPTRNVGSFKHDALDACAGVTLGIGRSRLAYLVAALQYFQVQELQEVARLTRKLKHVLHHLFMRHRSLYSDIQI